MAICGLGNLNLLLRLFAKVTAFLPNFSKADPYRKYDMDKARIQQIRVKRLLVGAITSEWQQIE
jgi:hypothetical protein